MTGLVLVWGSVTRARILVVLPLMLGGSRVGAQLGASPVELSGI